jgi:soluble lytic murein transglycosylase-like protein
MLAVVFALGAGGPPAVQADAGTPLRQQARAAGFADAERRVPEILSRADVRRYRRIFDLGEAGKWDRVDALIRALDNKLLVGHALAQRYLHPSEYWTPYRQAKAWMAKYHDLPYAPRIHELALQRRPENHRRPHRPTYGRRDHGMRGQARAGAVGSIETLSTRAHDPRARGILRQVRYNVLHTRLTISQDYLARDDVADDLRPVEADRARAMVAAGWYYYGDDANAAELAEPAAARSGRAVPMAHWIAGLAAWRQGAIADAAPHFIALARHTGVARGARAAGAYWAARAKLRLREPAQVSHWLRRAAAHPQTFYGMLGAEALGVRWPLGFDASDQRESVQSLRDLMKIPAGRRALALMQVGERERARRELLGIDGWDDPERLAKLLMAAERGGMAALAYRLGSRMAGAAGEEVPRSAVNAALYPIPPWRPATGFRIDRALLYALMRRESRFRPDAQSGAGARGLMQLMPRTASAMARRDNFAYSRRALFRPDLNLDLAQRYLGYLLDTRQVEGGLVRLVAAYNGGPGNLAAWLDGTAHNGDPLLFIESMPSRETRHFVERILTNLWIYRERLGQAAPSRAALAAGDWPDYVGLDAGAKEVARKP